MPTSSHDERQTIRRMTDRLRSTVDARIKHAYDVTFSIGIEYPVSLPLTVCPNPTVYRKLTEMPLPLYTLMDALFSGSDRSSRATIEGPPPCRVQQIGEGANSNACPRLLTVRGQLPPVPVCLLKTKICGCSSGNVRTTKSQYCASQTNICTCT